MNLIHLKKGLLAAIAIASVATANASEEIAKKNACLACHAIDEKVVGPSFKDIAKKYKGKDGASEKVAENIVKGSTGVWGNIPMPAQAQLSASDVTALATWILTLK
jgi:cytochrome c